MSSKNVIRFRKLDYATSDWIFQINRFSERQKLIVLGFQVKKDIHTSVKYAHTYKHRHHLADTFFGLWLLPAKSESYICIYKNDVWEASSMFSLRRWGSSLNVIRYFRFIVFLSSGNILLLRLLFDMQISLCTGALS